MLKRKRDGVVVKQEEGVDGEMDIEREGRKELEEWEIEFLKPSQELQEFRERYASTLPSALHYELDAIKSQWVHFPDVYHVGSSIGWADHETDLRQAFNFDGMKLSLINQHEHWKEHAAHYKAKTIVAGETICLDSDLAFEEIMLDYDDPKRPKTPPHPRPPTDTDFIPPKAQEDIEKSAVLIPWQKPGDVASFVPTKTRAQVRQPEETGADDPEEDPAAQKLEEIKRMTNEDERMEAIMDLIMENSFALAQTRQDKGILEKILRGALDNDEDLKSQTMLDIYEAEGELGAFIQRYINKLNIKIPPRGLEETENDDDESKRLRVDNEDVTTAEPATDAASSNQPDADMPDAATRPDSGKRYLLKLTGMSKNATQKDLKKLLDKEEITGINKMKKVHNMTIGQIWFDTLEQRLDAYKKLDGITLKKYTMAAEFVDEEDKDNANNSRPEGGRNEKKGWPKKDKNADETKVLDERTPEEMIKDQVTPLWRKPYDSQLNEKTLNFKNLLGKLKKKLAEFLFNRDITQEKKQALMWVKDKVKKGICPVENCVPSPNLTGYRTKCEFSIGHNVEGERSVGFMLGLYKDGITTVISPEGCANVSDQALKIAKEMETLIRASEFAVYDRMTKTGFWRLLQVRTQESGESMLIVQVNPTGVEADKIEEAKAAVISQFSSSECSVALTTILWQHHDGAHNGIVESFSVIHGPGFIYEDLLGLRFRISPTAFFQVNTKATEQLYSRIRSLCSLETLTVPSSQKDKDADASEANGDKKAGIVLLDLCCGTGTIGLTMASQVKRVIGIDIVPEAIKDAEVNAAANGVANAVYFAGKVEDVIKQILPMYMPKDVEEAKALESKRSLVDPDDVVVAVLDPPRTGVHSDVVKAVRACAGIQRVVFVSCEFSQSSGNIADFCRPTSNKFKGTPFRPVRAIPFDLFPHTPHCELLMELRRVDDPIFTSEVEDEAEVKKAETTETTAADDDDEVLVAY
ncbi:tRNA methyltransferase 2 [Phlyctochytrium planicorne]|nr:tRNA methyltransferase 2 [Phlyctochytrium planicorne]